MSEPCPFCGFEKSDFRKSHNWRCSQCGKDYANWLMARKTTADSQNVSPDDGGIKKQSLFSKREIPSEAEPVKSAQSLLVLAILSLLALNFVVDDVFSWIYPVSIPLAAYYAFTIHRTGYALGQHSVYSRGKNPIMYNVHLWGVLGYTLVAVLAWMGV
ncbi:hypothetical protein [Saccharospirillum salsuginis]|uniref:Uncharacterized protein n=1 Tax=Saccharospirillum salsuginis TaxID=418750 RepID=A0A918NIT0_9GAMM|nr:hypothetical protein [Saccharospirillum salsuginis]GGX70642.1 hypothetical protein GCM10007392_42650 [Saccharospirillum salsuginis]